MSQKDMTPTSFSNDLALWGGVDTELVGSTVISAGTFGGKIPARDISTAATGRGQLNLEFDISPRSVAPEWEGVTARNGVA
jgi:hypothetical protein